MKGDKLAGGFAQATLGPIAHNRPADAAGGCESKAHERSLISPVQRLRRDGAHCACLAFGRRHEVATLFQAFDGKWGRDGP
jgi:hypothetical protein